MSIQAEILDGSFSVDRITTVRGEGHQTLDVPTFTANIRFRIQVDKADTVLLKGMCYKYIQEKFGQWLYLIPDITLAHARFDMYHMRHLEAQDNIDGPPVPEGCFEWCYADADHRSYDSKYFSQVFSEVNFIRATEPTPEPGPIDWMTKITLFRDNGMVVVTPGLMKEGLVPVIRFDLPIKFALGHMSKHDAWQDDFKADDQPAVTEPA